MSEQKQTEQDECYYCPSSVICGFILTYAEKVAKRIKCTKNKQRTIFEQHNRRSESKDD